MSSLKIGIIGCGNISNQYLERSKQFPVLDVVGVADLDLDRARAQAQKHGVPKVVTVDELLKDESINLIVNLTIPLAHAEVALKAIEAGKHVYGEKPLAVTPEDGRRILDAAKAKGVRVGSAPDTFLGTSHQTCRALLDEGVIGKPVAATAFMLCGGHETWHPSPEFYYQKGGGPMFDMGPYYLTAMMNLFGPIRRVSGITGYQIPERTITSEPLRGKKIQIDTPDHVAGTIEFENGVIGTIIQSFATPVSAAGFGSPIQVMGTTGSIAVPDPNRFDGTITIRNIGDKAPHEVPTRHAHTNGRSLGVADMARAILDDRPHRASGELAFAVLDAMHGFLESSDTGRHYNVQGGFERPAMLPLDLKPGEID